MERRLAVILAADLVGFTRQMEQDEAGTWEKLARLRQDVVDPELLDRDGKIFKTTGDGLLVEFKSSIDAVEAAVSIQSLLRERSKSSPSEEHLMFRVGIDMGDVIVADGGDLIGDAVNVAARLQSISEPGGVCVSEAVYKAAHRNTEVPFEDIGPIELRNRAEPVRSFVWRFGLKASPCLSTWKPRPNIRPRAGFQKRTGVHPVSTFAQSSIAVLPFQNMSNDEELGYFSSGIAEDITTELYRFKSFSVIARTSSFMYAGEKKSAQEIGNELGARYILEGSVRKLGERIRVSAQLIDVETNDHVWAERFDIQLAEIFDAQDQIVAKIVGTLGDGIEKHVLHKSRHLAPEELEAYELMLRGLELHKQGYVSYEQAVEIYDLFAEAVEKDPDLGRARAWKVCAASRLWPSNADVDVINAYADQALSELNLALELNDEEPEAHRIYGAISMLRRDFEKAKFHIDRALAVNPNNTHVLAKSANFYSYYGNAQKALELLRRAITINPHHPDWYWQEFGLACWVAESFQDAVDNLVKSTTLTDFDHAYLAASYISLGGCAEAAWNISQLKQINPDVSLEGFVSMQPFRKTKDAERLKRDLGAAGLT